MREIRFRAWDKVVGCWSTDKENSLAEIAILLDGSIDLADDCGTYKPADFIIEQYTGLKDKNGKEIYEGDIVQSTYHRGIYITAPVICEDVLTWEWGGHGNLGMALTYPGESFEVIGNIHENPDLLNHERGKP